MAKAGRIEQTSLVRRVWRLHFWAGLFALPVLLSFALTGLVILYTQPIERTLNADLTVVEPAGAPRSLTEQVNAAVAFAGSGATIDGVTPAPDATSTTRVDFTSEQSGPREVFVNPYTAQVTGSRGTGDGLVGMANRVHASMNAEWFSIPVPSISHWVDREAHPDAFVKVSVGRLIVEIMAVWTIVLIASGVFLWWPRKSQKSKPRLRIRWSKGGRIRWQDLHSTVGILGSVFIVGFIVTGLPWSAYWGSDWRTVAEAVTPSTEPEVESSGDGVGKFDRLGRKISWAAQDDKIAASPAPGAAAPQPLDWESGRTIAASEGMLPGYSIMPPSNTTDDATGKTTYGTFVVMNHWPQRLSEQRTLFLDQFTGATLANGTADQSGLLAQATDFGVNAHMGTQFGVLNRIVNTVVALGIIVMSMTAVLMWWKRRPATKPGLPGPVSARTRAAVPTGAKVGILAAFVVLGIIYPSFGFTAVIAVIAELIFAARAKRGSAPAEPTAETDEGDEALVPSRS